MKNIRIVCLIALSFALASCAQADLTMVLNVTVKGLATDSSGSIFETNYNSNLKLLWSGHFAAVCAEGDEIKLLSILDTNSGMTTTLYPATKEYSVNTSASAHPMPVINWTTTERFVKTNVKKTMLGYNVELYKLYTNSSGATTTGSAWFAPDIQPPANLMDSQLLLNLQTKKYAGMPLLISIKYTSKKYGTRISMTYKVTNVSTAPIPAPTFQIPTGYKKVGSVVDNPK